MNIQIISRRDPVLNNENFNSKTQNLNNKLITQESSQSSSMFPREFGKDITNVLISEPNNNIHKDNVNK